MVKQVGLFGRPAAEESPQLKPRAPRKAKARKVAEGNRLPWAKASGEGELPKEPTINTSTKPTEDDTHGEQGEPEKQGESGKQGESVEQGESVKQGGSVDEDGSVEQGGSVKQGESVDKGWSGKQGESVDPSEGHDDTFHARSSWCHLEPKVYRLYQNYSFSGHYSGQWTNKKILFY